MIFYGETEATGTRKYLISCQRANGSEKKTARMTEATSSALKLQFLRSSCTFIY
jgi:hypothetical protein